MSEKQFEEQLKKKFKDYEMPVTANLWPNISSGIGSKSLFLKASYKWLIAGMVVGGAAIGTYFTISSDPKENVFTSGNENQKFISPKEYDKNDQSLNPSDSNSSVDGRNSDDAVIEQKSGQLQSNEFNKNDNTTQNNPLEKYNPTKESQIESSSFATAKTHCVGAEVSFNSPSTPDDVSFLWNFGDGSFSNESNPKHKYLNPGTYVVSLSVSGHKSAQINTMNMSETITILTTPKADFDWSFDNVESGKPLVSIDNNSEAAVNFEWNFHDGKKSNEFKPTKVIASNGKFPISITAIHENGCKDTKIKYVSINDNGQIQAPAQTLAGQGFLPEGLKDLKGSFVMSIFDNGKKIFETKTIKRPWTGIDNNGRYHEVNKQYTWIIITKDNNSGASNYFSGKVLLKP